MFINRLKKVFRHRSRIARKMQVSCYRIYDLDMPEFPLCIDLYEDNVYVAEYHRNHQLEAEAHQVWLNDSVSCIAEVTGANSDKIFIKQRKVIEERGQQYTRMDHSGHEIVIQENGYNFLVNLQDYLDTGLFLDHRITRKMVGEESAGKKMLNLFAYTGSFSVYAAMGGASKVHTVDLSNTYLNWAKKNFQLNGLMPDNFEFSSADVLHWLPTCKSGQYDLVVCDPPTFSNSKKMTTILDTQRDHVRIINECLRVMTPGGHLYFSTNYRKFKLQEAEIQASSITDITAKTTPFDFEGKLDRWCFYIVKD
ncbi:MAG: class I SAM-dependent methyltransferase [Saprospiraceae bacterium]|nr:class I SAM-dependent methyltransferase [Saprospiraceae bacterium]